jgi:glucose/arabinose dehydrogenase
LTRVLAVVALALWVSEPTRALPPPQVTANGAELPSPNLAFADLDLSVDNLAEDLDTPWDLVWGPDDWIWFTERRGTVSRVQMIGKPISERNRETAIKGEISRERSTDRGSQTHNGGEGRHLSGQTRR